MTRFDKRTAGNYAVVRLPDGKLVTAGHVNDDFALATYTPDGQLITSIGHKARRGPIQGQDIARIYALALQPDGRVVAAGVGGGGPDRHT